MASKSRVTPFDLELDVHDAGDDHYEISIEPKLNPDMEHGYSFAETLAGYRWIAGIAARVAGVLLEDLQQCARRHHCCTGRGFSCGMTMPEEAMANPAEEMDPGPAVWIGVPAEERKQWTKRVQDTLRKVVESEAWQPSAQDEAKWRGDTTPPTVIRSVS